ncbi:ABC transporter substrate-binding protein [Streptomyces oceani]|uniref:ABC transporter substrate-binding protein n=1 Tax=Streptomyces oceani TaxID=1075402 RepID=A0A1E7KIY9_9ACTN|nr:sugar ABC transporter substrate-binding protein [Streptomyces oceani]OEV03875.1 ABC transporter substrate-binding protein [Streptomyces oceani]
MPEYGSTEPLSRRRLMGLAGGAAAAVPLSACGSGAPEAGGAGGSGGSGTVSVYWNAGHDYAAYRKVIAAFEKEHGVRVRMQKYQWPDMRTRILADFASGNVPDLLENTSWVQEFALSGNALNLQKYVERDGADIGYPDDWQDATIKRNTHEGDTYGIQLHQTCSLLLYNKRMFREANVRPPTTWDEVVSVGKELTRGDVHALALNQDYTYAWPWLLQNGVRHYDPKTKDLLIPRSATLEALQFQADLVHKHKISPVPVPSTDYSGPQKLLSAERVAMIVSGPWDLEPIRASSPELELGVAQVPRKEKQSTILAGSSLLIPAKAKNPDLAWDLIKRLTQLSTEIAVTKKEGMLMPRKSWAKDPVVQNDPVANAFAEGLTYAEDAYEDLYLTGHYGELSGELFKVLYQGVIMERKPVEEAYEKYVDAGRKLIEG